MFRLTSEQLKKIMPRIPAARATAFIANQKQLDRFGITETANRYAMWLANVAHECGEFNTMVENGNYSLVQIRKTWPGRFKSDAAAAPYARNPAKLFNNVYANRMGNGPPSSGDGFKYRGRGEAQITGKDGYKNVGHVAAIPLVEFPDHATEDQYMNLVGGAFWHWKGLNRLADAGDFYALVGRWNGGHIGMADRNKYLRRALDVLKTAGHVKPAETPLPPVRPEVPQPEIASEPIPAVVPPLEEPARTPTPSLEMEAAQKKLRELGYFPGGVDGDEGTLTRDAILSFQANNHLPITGKVDEATWAELSVAGPKWLPESRTNATASTLREKGSETVTLGDKLKGWAKWLMGGGAVVGVADNDESVGIMGTVRDYADHYSTLRYIVEPIKEVWGFIRENEFIFLIVIGVGVWFAASRIIKSRVEDERTGANRGR